MLILSKDASLFVLFKPPKLVSRLIDVNSLSILPAEVGPCLVSVFLSFEEEGCCSFLSVEGTATAGGAGLESELSLDLILIFGAGLRSVEVSFRKEYLLSSRLLKMDGTNFGGSAFFPQVKSFGACS